MRALFVHAGNMYGGTERVLETLARERATCPTLESRFALCFEGRLADSLRATGAAVDLLGRVRVTRPDLVVQARRRLTDLLQRDRHDVIVTLSSWSHAIFAPVARRSHVPLVTWVHDVLAGRGWLERLEARQQPELVICNSRYTEAAARDVFPNVASEVIYCPLSIEDAGADRDEVRRQLSTPHDAVVVVQVGRMEPYKGQAALIDALARLDRDRPWTCWIVGGSQRAIEAEYERTLKEKVNQLGLTERVQFLGQRQDVPALLAAADIYCHPNQGAEPFGLSIIEAMHAGLPVVATRLGGPEEIVTNECGRLVAPGDVVALAAELQSLIVSAETRATLGRNGPARAWTLCEPAARLAQLSAALERVVAGRLRASGFGLQAATTTTAFFTDMAHRLPARLRATRGRQSEKCRARGRPTRG